MNFKNFDREDFEFTETEQNVPPVRVASVLSAGIALLSPATLNSACPSTPSHRAPAKAGRQHFDIATMVTLEY